MARAPAAEELLAFRPLSRADFGLLATWLAEPEIARWWNDPSTPEALEREYGAAIDGREPAELRIASIGDHPLGYIQRYPIAAYPEYVEELEAVVPVPPGALSVDYLIGDARRRGRGLGARMIARFVADAWGAYPDAHQVIVPVNAGNVASWRALERAGFARIAEGELEPDNPRESRAHVVYAISRPSTAPRTGPRTSR